MTEKFKKKLKGLCFNTEKKSPAAQLFPAVFEEDNSAGTIARKIQNII